MENQLKFYTKLIEIAQDLNGDWNIYEHIKKGIGSPLYFISYWPKRKKFKVDHHDPEEVIQGIVYFKDELTAKEALSQIEDNNRKYLFTDLTGLVMPENTKAVKKKPGYKEVEAVMTGLMNEKGYTTTEKVVEFLRNSGFDVSDTYVSKTMKEVSKNHNFDFNATITDGHAHLIYTERPRSRPGF